MEVYHCLSNRDGEALMTAVSAVDDGWMAGVETGGYYYGMTMTRTQSRTERVNTNLGPDW